jgi:hypothetical protein
MYLHRNGFRKIERLLNLLHLYVPLQHLIDYKLLPSKNYSSDLYKYSTGHYLVKQFNGLAGHDADFPSGNLGFGFLHHSFINTIKPERILCVGSLQGFIPAICALACKDNHKGHVDFVDAGKYSNEENDWGGVGFWKDHDLDQHFSAYGLNHYLTPYIMSSKEFAKKYKKRKYEYIYIDADHSYEGAKADYNLFWPSLAVGGIISFHDINMKGLHHGKEFGVWKLWQELGEDNKLSFVNGHYSVGFIQKTK